MSSVAERDRRDRRGRRGRHRLRLGNGFHGERGVDGLPYVVRGVGHDRAGWRRHLRDRRRSDAGDGRLGARHRLLARPTDAKHLSRIDLVPVREPVGLEQLALPHAELLGDPRDRVAAAHRVATVGGRIEWGDRGGGLASHRGDPLGAGVIARESQLLSRPDVMAAAQTVQRLKFTLPDPVAGGDARQRLAGLHQVIGVARLLGMTFGFRHFGQGEMHRAREFRPRHLDLEATGDPLLPLPDAGSQGRIGGHQRRDRNAERAGDRVGRRVEGQLVALVLDRRVPHEMAEVALRLFGDPRSGEELHIEVARGEAEASAAVLPDDPRDVPGAELLDRAPHAGGTVVVRGDRQRPAAGDAIVLLEQACGRDGRPIGIEAFVDDVVDLHEAAARRARELPEPRRADARVGGGV